jgi:predicted translin family RNA/ssDNA-binding protein
MSTYSYPHTIENGAGERLTFVRRVQGSAGGDRLEVESTDDAGVNLSWIARGDARIGRAGTPEDRASANAWSSFDEALLVSISGEEAKAVTRRHPGLLFAGYVQDAQKEYAEARVTEAVVLGKDLPGPDDIGVQDAPYLNGLAEAIGETRRTILDHLRAGDVERGEQLLQVMDDLYSLLVTIDYPDAITGNLRRSTDVARSIMEKTRGDLSLALVQKRLGDALERHARDLHQDR